MISLWTVEGKGPTKVGSFNSEQEIKEYLQPEIPLTFIQSPYTKGRKYLDVGFITKSYWIEEEE